MKTLLLTALLALAPLAARAQTGAVEGTVRDAAGQPLAGANVRVEGTRQGSAAGADGRYRIAPLAPGAYQVTASLVGYRTLTRGVVVAGGAARLDFVLEAQPVEAGAVVVTASRNAQARDAVAHSVSVVTPRDIESRGLVTLDAALRQVPGVQLADNQVSIRGSSGFSYNVGSRVLLLVDGVPMLGPDSEGVPFEILPLAAVDRVEVVRGPGSALYGSGALGGVVNVLTRDFPDRPATFARAQMGAYLPVRHAAWRARWDEADAPRPFYDTGFFHARRLGTGGLWLSASYRRDVGYTRLGASERLLAYGKWGVAPSARTRLSLLGGATRSRGDSFLYWNGLDDPLNPGTLALGGAGTTGSEDNLTYRFSALPTFTHTLSPRLFYRVAGRFFGVSIRPLDAQGRPRAAIRGTAGYRYGGEVQAVWQAPGGLLTGGGALDANAVRSNYFGTDPPFLAQPEGALFAQWEWRPAPRLDATLGLRFDAYALESRQVEKQLSPKLSLAYRLSEAWRLRASAGRGFRVPGVTERYVDDSSLFPILSNPALKPETSTGYEVGARGLLGPVALDGAVFWTDFRRLVEPVFVAEAGRQGFQFVNLTRARIRGLEVGAEVPVPSNRGLLRVSYQLLDARDLSENRALVFRSRHLVQATLDLAAGRWSAGADARYSSRPDRVDSDFARFVPDADQLVSTRVLDLRAGARWRAFTATLLVRNALDYYYAERPAILAPPRSLALQLTAAL